MDKNFEFTGRHYDDEEKSDANRIMNSWVEKALKPIKGEQEKSEEEIRMVDEINVMIAEEFSSIGISDYRPIDIKKVHILSGDVFEESFPDFQGNAFFRSIDDAVYINKDRTDSKARLFQSILHEIIHRSSTQKFYIDDDGGIYDARVGYRIRSPKKEPNRVNRLTGLNEIMNDYTVYKILLKNRNKLNENFGITDADVKGPIYAYMHYGAILEPIIKRISLYKNISLAEAFAELERGQFKDNLLVLKDVEKSCGEGSLEILSLLHTLKSEDDNKKLEGMIRDYFVEEDEAKRVSLGEEIKKFYSDTISQS